jgi:hypothetical protein
MHPFMPGLPEAERMYLFQNLMRLFSSHFLKPLKGCGSFV